MLQSEAVSLLEQALNLLAAYGAILAEVCC